jgi:hypothetical protein
MELDKAVLMYRFNYGQKIQVPNVTWFIEGAGKNILVDSASEARLATEFRGLPAKEIVPFEESLGSVGLNQDIEVAIKTYLQWDHYTIPECKNAKVLVQEVN